MTAPASIEFDHVKLDPTWRIQTDGNLKQVLDQQYMRGRVLTCAASLGLAQAAMDDALERCAMRHVRGEALGKLPQIEAKLADMSVKIRLMEAMLAKAANSISDGETTDEQRLNCALMKYCVPRAATEVADSAIQIFGGAGYTDRSRRSNLARLPWQSNRPGHRRNDDSYGCQATSQGAQLCADGYLNHIAFADFSFGVF